MTDQPAAAPISPVIVIVTGILATLGFFAACATCAYGIVTVNKAIGWTGALGMVVMGILTVFAGALEVDARRGLL